MTELDSPKGGAMPASYDMPERPEQFRDDIDLASRWLGASVLAASDESFGEKENLLKPEPAYFEPGHYSHRGEIVDGWETKRRRQPGHDWAIIRLGAPGVISGVDVDTSFFTGNFPTTCKIEASGCEGYPSPEDLNSDSTVWNEIVPMCPLAGDCHNHFTVTDKRRFTHIRLSAFPDGGIARLRVYGRAVPDPRIFNGLSVDLASRYLGGRIVSSSDGFYSSASVLNRPDVARTMGEGWETRRRRDDDNDFAIIQLAYSGSVRLIEVDTAYFKYNASAAVSISGSNESELKDDLAMHWFPVLDRQRLQPDTMHRFRIPGSGMVANHLRFDVYPDGGISRIRIFGDIEPSARIAAGQKWFAALPTEQAVAVLAGYGYPHDKAREVVAAGLQRVDLDKLYGENSPGGRSADETRNKA
ncbi:MAG: allantoicase [Albidovulum sp.]